MRNFCKRVVKSAQHRGGHRTPISLRRLGALPPYPRASVEKFPGEANGKEVQKIIKKRPKNSFIKPFRGGRGEGNGKKYQKRLKIAKKYHV